MCLQTVGGGVDLQPAVSCLVYYRIHVQLILRIETRDPGERVMIWIF